MPLHEIPTERNMRDWMSSQAQSKPSQFRRDPNPLAMSAEPVSSGYSTSRTKRNFSTIDSLLSSKSPHVQRLWNNIESEEVERRRKFARKSPIEKDPVISPVFLRSNRTERQTPLKSESKSAPAWPSPFHMTQKPLQKCDTKKSTQETQAELSIARTNTKRDLKQLLANTSKGRSTVPPKLQNFQGSALRPICIDDEPLSYKNLVPKSSLPTSNKAPNRLHENIHPIIRAPKQKEFTRGSKINNNSSSTNYVSSELTKHLFMTAGEEKLKKNSVSEEIAIKGASVHDPPGFSELERPNPGTRATNKSSPERPRHGFQFVQPLLDKRIGQQQHETKVMSSQAAQFTPINGISVVKPENILRMTSNAENLDSSISPAAGDGSSVEPSYQSVGIPSVTHDSSIQKLLDTQKRSDNITFISKAEGASLLDKNNKASTDIKLSSASTKPTIDSKVEDPNDKSKKSHVSASLATKTALGAELKNRKKKTYKNEPVPPEKVSGDDLLLLQLNRKGWEPKEIHARWAELTGLSKSREYLRTRSRRLRATFPELFQAEKIDERCKAEPVQTLREGSGNAESNESMRIEAEGLQVLLKDTPPAVSASKHPKQGGKKISDDLKKYILDSLNRDENDDSDLGVDEGANNQYLRSTESPEASDDVVHYAYLVVRRSLLSDVPENEWNDWYICGEAYASIEEANRAVVAEMTITRGDSNIWPITKWEWGISPETGLFNYIGTGENGGCIQVKVDRLLRNYHEDIIPPSKVGWAKRRVFDIIERRSTFSQTIDWDKDVEEEIVEEESHIKTSEGRENDQTDNNTIDDLFEENTSASAPFTVQPRTIIRTITRTKVITKTENVTERPVGSINAARDRANRLAGESFLELKKELEPNGNYSAQQQFRQELAEQLDQAEANEENFEAEMEMLNGAEYGDDEGAPEAKKTTLRVRVVERTLENPRNI